MHMIFCNIRLLRKDITTFQQIGEEPLRHSLIYVVLRLSMHMSTFQNILGVLYNKHENDRKSLSYDISGVGGVKLYEIGCSSVEVDLLSKASFSQ